MQAFEEKKNRNQELYCRWKLGESWKDLAVKFNLSRPRVYQIIGKMRYQDGGLMCQNYYRLTEESPNK
jgi:Mor family transcriptional regulator